MYIIFQTALYLIEAIIVYQFISSHNKKKYSFPVMLFSWSVAYLGMSFVYYYNVTWLNIIVFFTLNVVIIFTTFESSFVKALFDTVIVTVGMCLSEIIPIALFSELATRFETSRTIEFGIVFIALLSKFLFFIITRAIMIVYGRRSSNSEMFDRKTSIINIVPILSVGIFYVYLQFCLQYELDNRMQLSIALSGLALIVINITVYWEQGRIIQRNQEKMELEMMLQKQKQEVEYYELVSNQREEQQILLHDFKKHMEYVRTLYAEGMKKEADKYVDDTVEMIDRSSIKFSNNKALNVIMVHYYNICQKREIDISIDIRKTTLEHIENTDLTALFGNLLENGLESVIYFKQQTNEKAYIEISVNRVEDSNRASIFLINSCKDNPFIAGKLLSRKKGENHGIGIKSIKKVVKKYDGQMNMYYDDEKNEFHTLIVL